MSDDLSQALDALTVALTQVCWSEPDYSWTSVAVPAYAEGLRLLAKHGRVRILTDDGRSLIHEKDRCQPRRESLR